MTQPNTAPPRPGPRLSAIKRNKILTALATRERYSKIADDIGCSRQTVSYYADLWSDEIDDLRSKFDIEAAESSFENQKKRIQLMSDLVENIVENELKDGKTTYKLKSVGPGGTVVENELHAAAAMLSVSRFLADISAETGDRKQPPQSINMFSSIKGFSIMANPDLWDEDAPEPPQLPTETR